MAVPLWPVPWGEALGPSCPGERAPDPPGLAPVLEMLCRDSSLEEVVGGRACWGVTGRNAIQALSPCLAHTGLPPTSVVPQPAGGWLGHIGRVRVPPAIAEVTGDLSGLGEGKSVGVAPFLTER